MQESNLIKSLQYLEDTGKHISTEVKNRKRNLSNYDGDFETWWKFYKDLVPHLDNYATGQNNEHINELVNKYQEFILPLDSYFVPAEHHTSLLSFIIKWITGSGKMGRQDLGILLEDISNNVGNLLYQVKINAA
ncbi:MULTISPECIES: hypothetical protein [Niastella]|uniref:Uncharacterized protein n=1 Tax=Niastella soli TaxID=2821487 RepID=A0ABS3Z3D9_9BACT|nr:hypothetical protein [Niastella soli]MBO9204679.1 hypothetical protein [Niastella soli]